MATTLTSIPPDGEPVYSHAIDGATGEVRCLIDDPRTAAMVVALRYARDHRRAGRHAFDFDEWQRLVDAAIGPFDPSVPVPDTYALEAARLAIDNDPPFPGKY